MQFVSAEVGAQITYKCNARFTPEAPQVAVCTQNRSWTPDPAQLLCEEPHQGYSLGLNLNLHMHESLGTQPHSS